LAGAARAVARPRKPLNDLLLLPPLKAPNDPEVLEQQDRARRDDRRRKLAFQKQNAEATLAALAWDVPQQARKTEEVGMIVAEEETVAEVRRAQEEEEEEEQNVTEAAGSGSGAGRPQEGEEKVEDTIMELTEVAGSAPM
jgi:hypothetical protein